MRALDIVLTPNGSLGIITETNDKGGSASIEFIGNLRVGNDKNAWWRRAELTVVDSLPKILARTMYHPFGRGGEDVKHLF